MTENFRLIKGIIRFINKDKIPKEPDQIFKMLRELEQEKKEYTKKMQAIRRIKQLQREKKERNKKPDKKSIFNKCKVCKELYLKSERHQC